MPDRIDAEKVSVLVDQYQGLAESCIRHSHILEAMTHMAGAIYLETLAKGIDHDRLAGLIAKLRQMHEDYRA